MYHPAVPFAAVSPTLDTNPITVIRVPLSPKDETQLMSHDKILHLEWITYSTYLHPSMSLQLHPAPVYEHVPPLHANGYVTTRRWNVNVSVSAIVLRAAHVRGRGRDHGYGHGRDYDDVRLRFLLLFPSP